MDMLGIDIGTVSVKYVRVKGKKGIGDILSRGDYQYKGDFEDLGRILEDIKTKEGTALDVAIGLTSQEITKRNFTIPILPKEEIKEAMNWSASKLVSTPLEEMVYEFTMLGEIEERGIRREDVLFSGVQRSYVDRLLSVFENAGYERITLLTDIGFIYIHTVEEKADGSVAVVDIGGRQTGIYIIDEKKMKSVREIMTASESFTDALMSGLGLNYNEADQYKREKGFDERSTEILSVPLDRLAGEVQRTFNVYSQKNPERPVAKVCIAGRSARIPNLMENIRKFLAEETDYLALPHNVDDEYLPAYILCTKREQLVNLLPVEIRQKEKEQLYKKWVRTGTVGIIALLIIFSMNVWSDLHKTRFYIDSQKKSISTKREQLKMMSGTFPAARLNELMPLMNEAKKKDETLVFMLKYLSSTLPLDIYLKEFELVGDKSPTTTKQDAKANQPTPGAMNTPAGDYFLAFKGYIHGDMEVLEPILLKFVIKLEEAGFARDVKIVSKEIKETKTGKVMEFTINARCVAYEI